MSRASKSLGRMKALAALLLSASVLAAFPGGRAGAAGAPLLDGYIIGDPFQGWVGLPVNDLNETVQTLQQAEAAASSHFGLRTQTAAEGWHDPSASQNSLLVVLVRLYDPHLSDQNLVVETRAAASAASSTFCVGATGEPAASNQPFQGLTDSHLASCHATPNGAVLSTLAWSKGNTFALLVFTSLLTSDQLRASAQQQNARLPRGVAAVAGAASSSDWPLVAGIAGGAIVVIAMCVFGIVVGRRKRRTAIAVASDAGTATTPVSGIASAPPAGWYPDPSGSGRRWWDGQDWTDHRQSDSNPPVGQ
jgi:hypothetical protein